MPTAPGKHLWLCIVILSLGACVPSFITPTPVPPLDANAISNFIGQTAEAAALQTAAAMPTPTPTAIATATSRSTFTPEPTFTPLPTFVIPSPTPVLQQQYYRLKHDFQLAVYNYKSRTFDGNSEGMYPQAPEIVPMFLLPKTTAGTGRTTMSGAWETFINAVNNYEQEKLNYLKADNSALFNTSGFPQMESLTMGGNIITLEEIQSGWGRVHTLDYSSAPDVEEVNFFTRPDLVHKFVVVGWRRDSKTTTLLKPPKGNLYYPLVSRRPVWVQIERLEAFPTLPMEVTVNASVSIQPEPGLGVEPTRFQVLAGDSVRIVEYHPLGSNVWGRLQRGGWIPLFLYPQYLTSWRMETVPPPP